ncbi:MAG: amidohydrolase family protein [Planctomycetes bacterium]|nr:amidohydrolase family protein [Planctomycetota bacterium]
MRPLFVSTFALLVGASTASAQIAIIGETVHTMAGPPIKNGVVIIAAGKIQRVGAQADVQIPERAKVLRGKVVTPGLIDAHSTVGLTGYLNQDQDQDQLDSSDPMQPELRAIDSYNPQERLIDWVRGFGITTLHTGHAPGALISGQTMIVKTAGLTVEEATVRAVAMVAVTLGDDARSKGKDAEKKAPGTRSKAVAMLREELIKAQEYVRKQGLSDATKRPDRDLRLEILASVLKGDMPLLITANRAADLMSALRVADEFKIKIVLDGAAEAYLIMDPIKAAGVPVILHPSMRRGGMGETENVSYETAGKLRGAGIPVALQSGYESYVPKTRVALFEAGIAAANGLTFEQALASVTIDAAKILGIADRVGTLEAGKDGDVAVYDGDPFEYTSHCIGVVINGKVVSEESR